MSDSLRPVDCSPPSSSVHGILQARILEWVAISFSKYIIWPSLKDLQFSLVTQSCLTLWDPMDYSTPGFLSITNSQSLLKLMSMELVMPSNHLILCCPLPLLPSIFPSIRVFSNESVLRIRWPKYYSFSFSISSLLIVYSFFSVLIKHFLYLINPCI